MPERAELFHFRQPDQGFALPALCVRAVLREQGKRCGTVEIVGRTVYRRASEAGLVFRNLSAPASQGIQSFVEERILAE